MISFTEQQIDLILDRIDEDNQYYQSLLVELSEEQLSLVAFLVSEGLKVLNDEEQALLQYLSTVIYGVIKSEYADLEQIPVSIIEEEEERNWSEVEEKGLKQFKAIADHAFEGYPHEDLLAFIEDALIEDEEYEISDLARNVIFISAKTIIDSFHKHLTQSQ